MAGFLDTSGRKVSSALSNLSKFGTRHEDLLLKNSQAIGNKLGNTSTLSNRLKKQNTHNRHNTKKNMKPQPESNQILTNPNLFPPINGKPGISV